jgi:hypothetical protein
MIPGMSSHAREWKLQDRCVSCVMRAAFPFSLGHYSIKKGPDLRAFWGSSRFGRFLVIHSLTLRRFRRFGSSLSGWRGGGKYVRPFESHDAGYEFSSPIFIERYDSVHVIHLADRS